MLNNENKKCCNCCNCKKYGEIYLISCLIIILTLLLSGVILIYGISELVRGSYTLDI